MRLEDGLATLHLRQSQFGGVDPHGIRRLLDGSCIFDLIAAICFGTQILGFDHFVLFGRFGRRWRSGSALVVQHAEPLFELLHLFQCEGLGCVQITARAERIQCGVDGEFEAQNCLLARSPKEIHSRVVRQLRRRRELSLAHENEAAHFPGAKQRACSRQLALEPGRAQSLGRDDRHEHGGRR